MTCLAKKGGLLCASSQVRYMSSTDAKVEQMFQILLDPKEKGTEKKQKVQVLE